MMNARWLAGRTFRVLFVPLMLAGALIGAGPGAASASPAGPWTRVATPDPGSAINNLGGVAAVSPHLAWAVGGYSNIDSGGGALIDHWNGSSWTHQSVPNPGRPYGQDSLYRVAATSPANAWAVGTYTTGGPNGLTLIEHWDGTAWKRVPSPNRGVYPGGNFLDGVAATSPANAWAVGEYYNISNTGKTLILHWDGTAWTQVPSPNPKPRFSDNQLTGVAATSATNAWAVGYSTFGGYHTLIEHWNGTAWTLVPSPDPLGPGSEYGNILYAVAATSPTNAWAVGDSGNSTLILHWDGTAWTRVPSPNPSSSESQLYAVAATSPTSAWAVGDYGSGQYGPYYTLILHWNGTGWSQVNSPNPPGGKIDNLYAVSASSAANVWAVGDYYNHITDRTQTLALHCC
jgi:hypothetical protein